MTSPFAKKHGTEKKRAYELGIYTKGEQRGNPPQDGNTSQRKCRRGQIDEGATFFQAPLAPKSTPGSACLEGPGLILTRISILKP